jgi:hypothetical protein
MVSLKRENLAGITSTLGCIMITYGWHKTSTPSIIFYEFCYNIVEKYQMRGLGTNFFSFYFICEGYFGP